MPVSVPFTHFKKRNGTIVPFEPEKITRAVRKAADAVSRRDGSQFDSGILERVTARVIGYLDDPTSEYYVFPDQQGQRIPEIEDVQDLVEIVLAEEGLAQIVAVYKRYRKTARAGPRPDPRPPWLGRHRGPDRCQPAAGRVHHPGSGPSLGPQQDRPPVDARDRLAAGPGQ